MKTCRLKIITANIIDETDSPQIHYISQNKKPKNNLNILNNEENNNLIHNIEENNIIQKEKFEKIIEENNKNIYDGNINNLENKNLEKIQENEIKNNIMDANVDVNDLCTISKKNIYEEQKINNIYNNINNLDNNYNSYNHLNNNYPYEIMNKKRVMNNSLRCLFKNRITKTNNNKNKSTQKSLSISKSITYSGANIKKNSKKYSKNNSRSNLNLNQSINKSFGTKNNIKSKSSASLTFKKNTTKNANKSINNKKNNNILRGNKKNVNYVDNTSSIVTSWKVVEKNDYNIGQTIDFKTLIDDLIVKECQLVREKEQIMQIFEQKLKPLREMNKKLINENNEELDKEDELNGELILLKNQYETLFNSLNSNDKKKLKDIKKNTNNFEDNEFNKKQKEIEEEINILNNQLINGDFILITKPADYYKISEEEQKSITLLLKGIFFSIHILDTDKIIDLIWKHDKQFQTIYFIVEELLNFFNLDHKMDRNALINYFYSFCKYYNYMNKNVFKNEFKKKIGKIYIYNKYLYMSRLINYHNSKIKSLLQSIKKKDIFNQGVINYDQFIRYLYDYKIIHFNNLDEDFEQLLEFLIYCMKKQRKLGLFESQEYISDNKSDKEKKHSLFDLYYESLKDYIDEYNCNNITNPFYLIRNYMKANDIINAEKLFRPIITEKNILKIGSKEYIDIIILNKYLRFKGIIKNNDKIIVKTFEEELVDINQFINDIYNDNVNEEKPEDKEEIRNKAENFIDEIFQLNY